MGPAVWILSLLVILAAVREKRRVQLWMLFGNIACLFGSVMVIIAPGNFVRSQQVGDDRYGLLWRFFLRSYNECTAVTGFLFPTLLILLFLLVLAKGIGGVRLGRRNVLLFVCALLSWGAMFLSPHYPDRASFGTMVLLICIILSMAGKIVRNRNDLAWILWAGVVLVWLRGMYFCCEYLSISWGWIL